MKILHYALGFPPYRTGGLTKFCMDIMQQQKKLGHEVALLWPGQMKLLGEKVQIKQRQSYNDIQSFEVLNPLPVSYDEGITEINLFTKQCDSSVYFEFLRNYEPNIVHIHTFMGMHKAFIEAAKALNVKTVFSVHDFFSICPKVTMFLHGTVCNTVSDCTECPQCNLTALPMKKIKALQSPLYRILKDSSVVKILRKNHRDQYLSGESGEKLESSVNAIRTAEDYKRLRAYYNEIVEQIDTVHYNSTVTKSVFEKFFSPKNSEIVSISHGNIRDNRKIKQFGSKLRMTYLGPQGGGKGFFLLKAALDEMWSEKQTFSLSVFFEPTEKSPYMKPHGRYSYSDLSKIFDETDLLIAPSVWYETFGYTVLEAMSYGVPVVISGTVGARDVIPEGCGIIVDDINKEKLKQVLQKLTPERLCKMNKCIVKQAQIMTLEKMNSDIMGKCY